MNDVWSLQIHLVGLCAKICSKCTIRLRTQKWQRTNFERSENFYGHELVQALWQKDAGEVALNHRIYLVHAI